MCSLNGTHHYMLTEVANYVWTHIFMNGFLRRKFNIAIVNTFALVCVVRSGSVSNIT